ncbi:MAG: sigma 54-interacting transcriptional regulator [Acidobacteria bacterium]|nr:sigma 54-interacting transcriptional regulator [Acidobacteriota bacterium]
MPRNLSNRKERSASANLFLRLGQCLSIDEVLEDLARLAAGRGISLCSVRFKRERLERELSLPDAGAVAGKIKELVATVEGYRTQLVVKFRDPMDGALLYELEYATRLAAHRIELLAQEGLHTDKAEEGSVARSALIDGLVGESELIRQVRQDILIAASTDLNVLITGEPGTGKELVARLIHNAAGRGGKPFVAVDFAAIDPDLIASELFGHEKGSFNGAFTRKIGLFERANGGSLFFKEIYDLPPPRRAMLLRPLDKHEIERVGGTQKIKVDIRLIAATKHDIHRDDEEGGFRRDLYDRLCGYPIRTPSLSKHPTDIPILIRHYFPFVEFQEDALKLLCRYPWPGNVDQLILMVKRLSAKSESGQIIATADVRREMDFEQMYTSNPGKTGYIPVLREGETLKESIGRIVLEIYERELSRSGSHSTAARRLGMNRTTLYDWLEWARKLVTK